MVGNECSPGYLHSCRDVHDCNRCNGNLLRWNSGWSKHVFRQLESFGLQLVKKRRQHPGRGDAAQDAIGLVVHVGLLKHKQIVKFDLKVVFVADDFRNCSEFPAAVAQERRVNQQSQVIYYLHYDNIFCK